jgi:hypothetical protein
LQAQADAAAWIAAHTGPGSSLFVWGHEPSLYELAHRRAASRYVYDEPMRVPWGAAARRAELLDALDRDAPQVFVVQHGDVFPFLTGNDRDSAEELAAWSELDARLRADYELRITFDYLDLWLRRPASASAPTPTTPASATPHGQLTDE